MKIVRRIKYGIYFIGYICENVSRKLTGRIPRGMMAFETLPELKARLAKKGIIVEDKPKVEDRSEVMHKFVERGDDVCGQCGKFRKDAYAGHFACVFIGHQWDWHGRCEICGEGRKPKQTQAKP